MKKLLLFTFIILLFISIYQDFTVENFKTTNHNPVQPLQKEGYSIAHVKVLPGDTVMSIVEKLNKETINQLYMADILEHFLELNPTTDPYNLTPYTFYYFPVYQQ